MSIWQAFFTPRSSVETEKSRKHRFVRLFFLLLTATLLCAVAALLVGSVKIDPWAALQAALAGDLQSTDLRILLYLRLPRVLAALLAGSALAVSGVLIQAVLNNPMAAPNVIGVNAGAGFFAILLVALLPSAVGFLPLAAFGGALCAGLLIYLVALRSGAGKTTVILVGMAVSSVLSAGISTVKLLFPDAAYDATLFQIGGLSGVRGDSLTPAWILILLGILAAWLLASRLDLLSLGTEAAHGLGLSVGVTRFLMLMLASLLAGSAVSFAGLLGFVGLLVPHIARRAVGNLHRRLIPVSALGGALLVLVGDLLARTLFSPYELPVGILLAFLGGPFFLALILLQRRRAFYD